MSGETMKNVMLDLETLGTKPGSAIIAIGAVQFDWGQDETQWGHFEFEPINLRSNESVGLVADKSTLEWWSKQDTDARHMYEEAIDNKGFHIVNALQAFQKYFPQGACIWGNGSDFDVVLLKAAYDACGLDAPWSHKGVRCFRTFKNEFSHLVPEPAFQGTRHSALADALHQTRWLQAIKEALTK